MSGTFIGVLVEGLVAGLLLVTIVYCVSLNRKLERLRSDEADMKELVSELIGATGNAEQAIQALKISASDWDRALGSRLRHAEKLSGALSEQTVAAEQVLDRLKRICAAARPAESSAAEQPLRTAAAARSEQKSAADIAAARLRLGLGRRPGADNETERAA
ncbi:MAG: chemotaxis protein [Rhodobiaceae bacterium]|nr:chemotaxis protein [Rhodobiaceae bacterium]MCC0016874.1 chemotaxis protein [Rhodobiaceae bacterium]MCC0042123.1 chemotaxis protein [Rhodobiaceae bacterium]